MYGLYLDAIHGYLRRTYGDDVWKLVRHRAGIKVWTFHPNQTYSDQYILRIARAASELIGKPQEALLCEFGANMQSVYVDNGNDKTLRTLARHVRGFIDELDNLHEQARYTFPKIKPPSFVCKEESSEGLTIRYYSRRRGLLPLVQGILQSIIKSYCEVEVEFQTLTSTENSATYFRMLFDNHSHTSLVQKHSSLAPPEFAPIPARSFLSLFPFFILFRSDMEIYMVGEGIDRMLPDILSEMVNDTFSMVRPQMEFTWKNIIRHPSCIFELVSDHPVRQDVADHSDTETASRDIARKNSYEIKDGDKGRLPGSTNVSGSKVQEDGAMETTIPEDPSAVVKEAMKELNLDAEEVPNDPQLMAYQLVKDDPKDLNKKEMKQIAASDVKPTPVDAKEGVLGLQMSQIAAADQQPLDAQAIMQAIEEGEAAEDPVTTSHRFLSLRGQMKHIPDWNSVVFLCTPVMTDMEDMRGNGLFLNDYSMHDLSRDMVVNGMNKTVEEKLALTKEVKTTDQLGENLMKLEKAKQKTDQLLYGMIPRQVAERLKQGEPALNTCETFESVTVLFCDVFGFSTICTHLTPMQVVKLLNDLYTVFDMLVDKYDTYKVETVGDDYMLVSGAPVRIKDHAERMCEMSMDMLVAAKKIIDPVTDEQIAIRIGMHTGTVVAGVVGIKVPRYCLFGDTVNVASRMETTGKGNYIHLSQTTREEIRHLPYVVVERGVVTIKGKGKMKTYWLLGRSNNEGTLNSVSPTDTNYTTSRASSLQDNKTCPAAVKPKNSSLEEAEDEAEVKVKEIGAANMEIQNWKAEDAQSTFQEIVDTGKLSNPTPLEDLRWGACSSTTTDYIGADYQPSSNICNLL
ncbi:GUCY1B3 [Branchiostoma lanceolatum]|uniref:guanylate cyclase n=2 Tax=Branchiostoma lanceolatum TaxID=7740 RepID=A0A8J9ZRV7_BRALA|nr:GUCY1B3 [Branchiostoma lanceolatum]